MSDVSAIQELIFPLIDQCKFLFYPDQWSKIFMDYSRNEIFSLLYLYRHPHSNMTEVAEYISVPLNTATGVISRMEKKGLAIRERDTNDKRVVTICLTEIGEHFISCEMKELGDLYTKVLDQLSPEEQEMAFQLITKIVRILTKEKSQESKSEGKSRVQKIKIDF